MCNCHSLFVLVCSWCDDVCESGDSESSERDGCSEGEEGDGCNEGEEGEWQGLRRTQPSAETFGEGSNHPVCCYVFVLSEGSGLLRG